MSGGLLFLVIDSGPVWFLRSWVGRNRNGKASKGPGFVGRAKSGGDSEERGCGSADVVLWVWKLLGLQRSKEGKTRIKKPRVGEAVR